MRPYQIAGLVLNPTTPGTHTTQTLALQQDLRALGYIAGGIDGTFGQRTARGIAALCYDLLYNDGRASDASARAPVAIRDYNKGRVTSIQYELNQPIAACLDDLMIDPEVPKLPRAVSAASENAKALKIVRAMLRPIAPIPFLLAMFDQESSDRHFSVPSGKDADDYITVGLDRNDDRNDAHITSRGYGLGQATLFHHPPTSEEIASLMIDVNGNVQAAFRELRLKFDDFVVGPYPANDRNIEHLGLRLRLCRYTSSDARYLKDCVACARSVRTIEISQGTELYTGSGDTYQPDKYYPSANYGSVPDRADFLCDWPYAARRYNGDGLNSYHYQTRILLNLSRQIPTQPGALS